MGCFAGFLVATFLIAGFTDRDYEQQAYECQTKIWELFVEGHQVSLHDMTEQECKAFLKEVDRQTGPFTPIECRWRYVCRTEL